MAEYNLFFHYFFISEMYKVADSQQQNKADSGTKDSSYTVKAAKTVKTDVLMCAVSNTPKQNKGFCLQVFPSTSPSHSCRKILDVIEKKALSVFPEDSIVYSFACFGIEPGIIEHSIIKNGQRNVATSKYCKNKQKKNWKIVNVQTSKLFSFPWHPP